MGRKGLANKVTFEPRPELSETSSAAGPFPLGPSDVLQVGNEKVWVEDSRKWDPFGLVLGSVFLNYCYWDEIHITLNELWNVYAWYLAHLTGVHSTGV